MPTYIEELEKQNEELQEKLAIAEKFIAEHNICIENGDGKPYAPSSTEIVRGWHLHDIKRTCYEWGVVITCKKSSKTWLGKTNVSLYSFVCKIKFAANTTNFSVTYATYPSNESIYLTHEEKFCESMFEMARHNRFVFIGTINSKSTVLDYVQIEKNGKTFHRCLENGIIRLKLPS
jgi:hypothetical protein